MKRWSRLVALLAVLAMVMAACGDAGGSDTTAGGPDTTAETPDTTAETPDTTTAPETTGGTDTTAAPSGDIATDIGVDLEAGTITIGLLSDLSGPF